MNFSIPDQETKQLGFRLIDGAELDDGQITREDSGFLTKKPV